jgi:Glucose-6-phosphate dehydrogenase, C-terminal domain
VKMDFHYDDWFPKEPNVGYETLIYDVMIGDPTLFMRADMVEQAWRIVQPVLDAWAAELTSRTTILTTRSTRRKTSRSPSPPPRGRVIRPDVARGVGFVEEIRQNRAVVTRGVGSPRAPGS